MMSRHWHIEDDTGNVQTVPRGSEGVVGQTPVLSPGQMFEYCSFAALKGKEGSMEGAFEMVDEAGQSFEVEVPRFLFLPP